MTVLHDDGCTKISPREFNKRIALVKKWFADSLCDLLNLEPVMAPLFVAGITGLNDHLNGYERPVSFTTKHYGNSVALEVVQSLAKWKRHCLKDLGFLPNEGIITDMRAIRRDEELSPIHSFYVTQWDWEKVIRLDDRNLDYLKETVQSIYSCIKETEAKVTGRFGRKHPRLPENIFFVHATELEERWPDKTAKEREDAITEMHHAVFIIGIGGAMPLSGEPHDGRACDYDDWTLNGDILLWHSSLKRAFEISSMGIRVDSKALKHQAAVKGEEEKLELDFHKKLLANELPLTIGGGIGQCRVVMYFLQTSSIDEVQPAYWPRDE